MSTWSPPQYLKFAGLRARPLRDLAARVALPEARRVIDLGCGPGVLADFAEEFWPRASICGIDSSPAMVEAARAAHPQHDWRLGDIVEWADSERDRYDVVFSNAALQWVDDHTSLFPKLFERVEPGGALAVQMPAYRAPQYEILREMAASPEWRRWFPEGRAREWRSQELDFYYDVLKPVAEAMDLWATEYAQPMADMNAVLDFYKSTGLRPYLDPIGEAAERERFLAEYAEKLRPVFPCARSGEVLFLMRRVFLVAQRSM